MTTRGLHSVVTETLCQNVSSGVATSGIFSHSHPTGASVHSRVLFSPASCIFVTLATALKTRSSAVAERPRDAAFVENVAVT